jgi:hypothetical protein
MTRSDEQLRAENAAIRDVLDRGAEARLRSIPGVIHVSLGVKEKEGTLTGQLCIRVYVRQKRNRVEVPAAELIPRAIEDVPTDVNMVAGEVELQVDNTRYRPLLGGIQITNGIVAGTAAAPILTRGTMGCAAIDKSDKSAVLLTAAHVLTANGGAKGGRVYQPAPVWLPPLTAQQLPFKPTHDIDKVAIIRDAKITDDVDAGIAAIDVSSCCNCCGIEYSNEIRTLGEVLAKKTIVGDEKAQAGMTVFKVGQATLRTAGTIEDANYPDFNVTHDGKTFPFKKQIAIRHTDPAQPFSIHGDSGAAVINGGNKIVGLLFAAGRNVPLNNAPTPFLSFANHIDKVLTTLNISIPYSQNVTVTAGQAQIPEPYVALRERLQRHDNTRRLLTLGERHVDEVTQLVNHCKPVTIAWHKNHGPALLATVMGAVRDGHERLPADVKGTVPHETVERMRDVLHRYGSDALQEHLGHPIVAPLIQRLHGCTSVNEAIERIAHDPALAAALRGIS